MHSIKSGSISTQWLETTNCTLVASMKAASHPDMREWAALPQSTSSASVPSPASTLILRAASTEAPPVRRYTAATVQ